MIRHKLLSIVIILGALATPDLVMATPTVTGTISRDTSVDRFDFTITVADSTKPELTAKEKDLFTDRLRIYLKDLGSQDNLYVPFAGTPEVAGIPFTVNQNGEIVKKLNSNNRTDFTFSVRITANASGGLKKLLDDKGSGKNISLMVRYYEDQVLVDKNESVTLSISTEIVEGAPESLTTTGTHKSLVAAWSNPATFDWTGTSTEKPSKLVALVIDKSATELNIPAYLYDSTAATDSEAPTDTCVFVPAFTDGNACISCNNTTAYLNSDKIEAMKDKGYFISTAEVTAGKVKIPGLENSKPYAVALFYQPGGLTRTTCTTGTPEADSTWSEVNGEDSASLSDPKCFIATAAYGSELHKNLRPLRWFRDQVLERVPFGHEFITWYYHVGPEAAKTVRDSSILKTTIQVGLWIPVITITGWMNLANATSFPIATILMSICLGAALWLLTSMPYSFVKSRKGN